MSTNREKNAGGSKSGKKVGFAPLPSNSNYQSNQSSTMGSNSNAWDTETDMLSYFLDGDAGLPINAGMPEFSHSEPTTGTDNNAMSNHTTMNATGGSSSSSTVEHSAAPSVAAPQHLLYPTQEYHHYPVAPPGAQQTQHHQTHYQSQPVPMITGTSQSARDEPMAPPTPKAPQYYAARPSSTSPKSKAPTKSPSTGDLSQQNPHSAVPSSASSSSSSLSTMANTLVSGGPILVQQMQQQHMYASMMAAAAAQYPPPHPMHGIPSPVSPAGMIGTPENMMLPPPPPPAPAMMGQAYRSAAAEAAAANSNSTPILPAAPPPPIHAPIAPQPPPPADLAAQHQAHLAWIRQVNEMARAGGRDPNSLPPPEIQPGPEGTVPPQPPPPILPQGVPPPPGVPPTASAPPVPPHQFGMPFSPYPHLTFYGHAAAAAASALQQNKNPPEESEEKKKQRLERNRESARKSRRRKKERLVEAELQVNEMHRKVANERERQIEKIVPGLRKLRNQQIEAFVTANMESSAEGAVAASPDPAVVMTCIRETGPSSPIFRSVLEFQGTSMHASLLPRYQKLWLWLALNEESFFLAGKEEYVKRDPDRMVVRTSSGKISSKQVGDELINGPAAEGGSKRSASKSQVDSATVDRTSRADDASRMWPLFCFEHQFSVDQEEKFMNLHKKIRYKHNIEEAWTKSQAAVRAASSLRGAMESVCQVASNREERTLVGVLTMDQILKYRQWTVMNHERCKRSMHQAFPPQQQRLPIATDSDDFAANSASESGNDGRFLTPASQEVRPRESLQDICQRLERVLRISKSGN